MRSVTFLLAALTIALGQSAYGALSGNLIPGGDFEDQSKIDFVGASGTVNDYRYFKYEHSPRTQAEIDVVAPPVRAWQFHPEYDFGRWMCFWGAGGSSSSDYDNMTGIGTWDDPRSHWSAGVWDAPVNTHNVSQDPLNPSNHVMEGVRMRAGVSMYLQAPANQTIGPAALDFDYYFNYWLPEDLNTPEILQVFVFGVPEAALPDWPDRAQAVDPDTGAQILHGLSAGSLPYDLLYESPEWNSQWELASTEPAGSPRPWVGSQGDQWQTLSDGVTDSDANYYDGTFTTTQTYPYYLVQLRMVTYSESHSYFWGEGGRPADTFAIGLDNLSLQLSIAVPLLGDVNLDGYVNNLDIAPFITLLTSATYQEEADVNQDSFVNNLDIAPFITILTGGAQAIPEPASIALLTFAGLAMWRRRS